MIYYDENDNEISEEDFNSSSLNKIKTFVNGNVVLVLRPENVRVVSEADKLTQARTYLESTNFKAINGTTTPEIDAKRLAARELLDGSFIEPPSDLFMV